MSLFCTHAGRAPFATAADGKQPTADGLEADKQLTPSALLHLRRQAEKPQNSNRNAYYRAEKKKLQIRVS